MSPNPDYKALKAEWYKKLKDEGFQDIEQDDENLKIWHSRRFKLLDPTFREAKEEYYRVAAQFLNEYEFENDRDRLIWELHSGGVSIRNISLILKEKGHPEAYRCKIHPTIKKLVKAMKNVPRKG